MTNNQTINGTLLSVLVFLGGSLPALFQANVVLGLIDVAAIIAVAFTYELLP